MLDKAILHGKEKRKKYRGAKRFDRSCRNHGGCPYCEEGRQHNSKVREFDAEDAIEEAIGR